MENAVRGADLAWMDFLENPSIELLLCYCEAVDDLVHRRTG
jgi:hypothetical protein